MPNHFQYCKAKAQTSVHETPKFHEGHYRKPALTERPLNGRWGCWVHNTNQSGQPARCLSTGSKFHVPHSCFSLWRTASVACFINTGLTASDLLQCVFRASTQSSVSGTHSSGGPFTCVLSGSPHVWHIGVVPLREGRQHDHTERLPSVLRPARM